MNSDSLFHYGNVELGVALPTPTSFRALPKLPGFNQKQLQAAADLESSFTRQSGLPPGTYTTFSEVKPLINVHDRLWDTLESELNKFERLDICKRLYEKLEIFIGHMHLSQYPAAVDLALSGRTEEAEKRLDMWRASTPVTEAVKFLVEMAVKHCGSQGLACGGSKLDFLIGLSNKIVMLDGHLDNLYDHILPYEINIAPNFSLSAGLASKAITAIDAWLHSAKPHTVEAVRDWMDTLNVSMGPKIHVEDFAAFPELVVLDKAMAEELGYGFFDWLNYVKGCMDFFGENEFLKVTGMRRLCRHVRDTVGLDPAKMELLLRDHALSMATVRDLSRKDMMPMENYRRDSRLLRRPLLDINRGNARIAIMGVETFSVGMRVFFDSLEYGTLQLPSMQKEGPMKSAIGTLQAKIGAPFRDGVAAKCKSMGFRVETEWPLPRKDETEKAVGPIDILAIDRKKRRLVLVEAKNLRSPGLVPKEMKEERDKFIDTRGQHDGGFVRVLKDKEKSFVSKKEWHLHELKLDGEEDYSVESVIVVNHAMFWPLVTPQPLPILDDLEFYKRLRIGQHLLTTPIATV